MKLYHCLIIIVMLLVSCRHAKNSELTEIPVDVTQNIAFPLSEIAKEITAINLELTDESLINPDAIVRILITENNIIVAETKIGASSQVLVFNKDGKFIRPIGSRGQGPGEYNFISNVAFDDKSKHLFIASMNPHKIICYDLEGKFMKEFRLNFDGYYSDINYINNELLVVFNHATQLDEDNKLKKTSLYHLDKNLQVIDSCMIRKNYYETNLIVNQNYNNDFIFKENASVYLYLNEVYPKKYAPKVKVLRDTLYRLEDNQLVPELKLKFQNDGFNRAGDKIIDLFNIYRSLRYVFAIYQISPNELPDFNNKYFFCYDTKTGQGYNMLNGYTDDINGIEKRVDIRPLHTDSEIFYYWHTNMKPNDLEEPNPTLYIIKLKK